MSTFYTFLLANQPKSALNDHGNKDTGDKLYCISVSAQIHQCKGSKERFLPKFRPCQYSNPQRATRLTQTWAMAPIDMQMLPRLMFIYLLPCLIPWLQMIQKSQNSTKYLRVVNLLKQFQCLLLLPMFRMYQVKDSHEMDSCWTGSKRLECSTFWIHAHQVTPHIDIPVPNTFQWCAHGPTCPLQVQMQIQACKQT